VGHYENYSVVKKILHLEIAKLIGMRDIISLKYMPKLPNTPPMYN